MSKEKWYPVLFDYEGNSLDKYFYFHPTHCANKDGECIFACWREVDKDDNNNDFKFWCCMLGHAPIMDESEDGYNQWGEQAY